MNLLNKNRIKQKIRIKLRMIKILKKIKVNLMIMLQEPRMKVFIMMN